MYYTTVEDSKDKNVQFMTCISSDGIILSQRGHSHGSLLGNLGILNFTSGSHSDFGLR